MSTDPPFERARAIADAVLFEGYALYPYRASSRKNQLRWQFGMLAPRTFSEAGGCEPWWMETECLVEAAEPVRLDGRVRFMQLRRRRVEAAAASENGERTSFRAVPSIDVEGRLLVPWDEGELREIDFSHALDPRADSGPGRTLHIDIPGDEETEIVRLASGAVAARVVQVRSPIQAVVRISVEPAASVPTGGVLFRMRLRVENLTRWAGTSAVREEVLGSCCVGAHLLLALSGGGFVSLLDPPPWATEAAASCHSVRSWPVLAGEPGRRDLVLCAPIILYDHPQVAPESPGDLFDATEIDEILTLRTMTLTDDEKRQARATDSRVAALIDRVDRIEDLARTATPGATAPDPLAQLHGTMRDRRDASGSDNAVGNSTGAIDVTHAADAIDVTHAADAIDVTRAADAIDFPHAVDATAITDAPGPTTLRIGAITLARGSRVRLRPGPRRADAQDMFLDGQTATVEAVMRDVEDHDCLAVLLENDPAADLLRLHGRYLYFYPEEVEPFREGEPA